jgi:hypothetical protein
MPFLGLIDLSGIQDYIYRSKQLRDIADASRRIEKFTAPGGLFAMAQAPGVKLIYSAGGNAAYRAADRTALRDTIRTISRSLLENHRGLEAVAVLSEYEEGSLADGYRTAALALDAAKQTQARSTEVCFSGLSWPNIDAETLPIRTDKYGYSEPNNFDQLICTSAPGRTNLMGVVSIDGIGMGNKVIEWLNRAVDEGYFDERFVHEFGGWSRSIQERWAKAWERALDALRSAFGSEGAMSIPGDPSQRIEMKRDDRRLYYPARRIYQGGDDLLFVSDARVAIALASVIAGELDRSERGPGVPHLFQRIPVSVGVLFVDYNYPFFRAAQLADDVRRVAKKAAMDSEPVSSHIDWWLNRQGAVARPAPPYVGATMRPYPLDNVGHDLPWLERCAISGLRDVFGTSRNKMKDLAVALDASDPRASVERLLAARPLKDSAPPFAFLGDEYDPRTGFHGTRTPLRDALELVDIHYSLSAARHSHGQEATP